MDKAELQRIEEHGADFFVTGNEYMRDALDLKFIPREHPDTRCGGG